MTSENAAPAEMPGGIVERIAAYLKLRDEMVTDPDERTEEERSESAKEIAALFAPILAEKERRDEADRKGAEIHKWLDEMAENPPPPSEALKKLLADYKASGIKSVALDRPFNACCYREHCKALEARALAAEAALAEAEERCAKWADKVAAAIRAEEFELASARLRPEPIPRTQKRADDPTNGAAG